ncbi:MAG: stage II sporulation protein M [Methanomicrobiales archaeon]
MIKFLKNIYKFYVKRYKKRFIYSFLVYYLLVILGGISGIFYSVSRENAVQTVSSSLNSTLPSLFQAINSGDLISVVLTIFGFNAVLGSFFFITLLNMIGIGTLIFIYRPFLWGFIYAPVNPQATALLIYVIPTLILEGLAYVMAFAASIDFLQAIIKPSALGEKKRLRAYKKAWINNLKSYVLILIVLFVAAVVETLTILYIIPKMG